MRALVIGHFFLVAVLALSAPESDVIDLLLLGLSHKEVAERLFVSPDTCKVAVFMSVFGAADWLRGGAGRELNHCSRKRIQRAAIQNREY